MVQRERQAILDPVIRKFIFKQSDGSHTKSKRKTYKAPHLPAAVVRPASPRKGQGPRTFTSVDTSFLAVLLPELTLEPHCPSVLSHGGAATKNLFPVSVHDPHWPASCLLIALWSARCHARQRYVSPVLFSA